MPNEVPQQCAVDLWFIFSDNQSSNTPLIVGVVVGVGGGIIVIVSAILIYIFCIRNRKSSEYTTISLIV